MTPEIRNVEWKRSWRDNCFAWICGFANARGGVLEIGKDDDGDIVGVRNVLSLLEDIPSKVRSLLGIVVEVNLKSESVWLCRVAPRGFASGGGFQSFQLRAFLLRCGPTGDESPCGLSPAWLLSV